MKVSNPQAGAGNPATSSPAGNQNSVGGNRSEEDKEKKFGSALEKKANEKSGLDKRPGADSMANGNAAINHALFMAQPQAPVAETSSASAATGVIPAEINALHSEITHALEVSGPNEVQLHFDAQVLDGLSVTLNREGGMLQVSMQVNSPEMARFLEAHASTLAQRLERPERPAFISIETRGAPRQDEGSYQQGGGHQQGRDRNSDEPQGRAASLGEDA